MKRSVWKWLLGISIAVLLLLTQFTIAIWALGNATGAIAGGIMGSMDPDNFGYKYLPLDDFLVNAVGSPVFYIYMADLAVLASSIVMLIVTRKQISNGTGNPSPTGEGL